MFFKTTIRALLKNKTYSFLNIFGLAIGVACAGLIFLWVENEMGYDDVNTKKDRLYTVMNNWPFAEGNATYQSTPGPLAVAMKKEIPGVVNTCRYKNEEFNLLFRVGDRTMYSAGTYADSSMFSMLTMPFVQGNAYNAFKQLHSLVITEKTAIKFFGTEKNIIGKTVKIDNKQDYVITGVIKDFPQNTTIQFEWFAPFDIYLKDNPGLTGWEDNSIVTLVELNSKNSFAQVNSKLRGFIKTKDLTSIANSFLFSMNDWHLRWDFANGKPTGSGRIQYVRMFTAIAWIILLLACINFMNLATARSEKRAKEVGVRKVLGSGRQRLIAKFMGEALFMSLLSVVAAVFLISIALPVFNTIAQKQLSLGLDNPMHIISLLAITLICGLVAGSYPSLYLSSFNPLSVLKGLKAKSNSAGFIRKGLVVLQFTVSTVLIISTVVIFQQIEHIKNRELGFNKNDLLSISVQGDMGKNFNTIKQHLLNTGVVTNAALTSHETIYGGDNRIDFAWKGKDIQSQVLISKRTVSPELLNTSGIKIIQGRDFSASPAADSANIIITETMAKMMTTKNVLGEIIREGTDEYHIIGVAQDFMYGDMKGIKVDPVIFTCTTNYADENQMYVRIKNNINPAQALAKVEEVIKKDNPAYPFTYKFVDDEFNEMFVSEMLVSKLSRIFAALAIIISCLGLFGLAAYTAERRTKEIGIRKVLGASVTGIAGLLSTEFVKLVIVSILLATPLAWYAMDTWLQSYAYRITISGWVFVAAGAVAMFIAIATISFQAIKAGLMNPVKAIKSE